MKQADEVFEALRTLGVEEQNLKLSQLSELKLVPEPTLAAVHLRLAIDRNAEVYTCNGCSVQREDNLCGNWVGDDFAGPKYCELCTPKHLKPKFFRVKAAGLVIDFPGETVQVYSTGLAGLEWPADHMKGEKVIHDRDFRWVQERAGNMGFDLEGTCSKGVWRRYKQPQDGGTVELVWK